MLDKLKESINMVDLSSSLKLMWQSMLAIFLVMAAISVIVYLFVRFSKK